MGYLEEYISRRQDILHKKSWAEDAPPESNSDYLFDKDETDIKRDVKEEDLYTDTNWIVSSKLIYDKFYRPQILSAKGGEKNVGTVGPASYRSAAKRIMNKNNAQGPELLADVPFEQMTDEQRKEYADFGLEFMGTFNYNLPMMGIRAGQLSSMEDDTKFRFLQMMKTYDDKDITWAGTGRFFKNMLTDPTTYVGLGTLGIGIVGRHGVQQTTKKGIIESIKGSVKSTTALAAYEGGTYFAADNALRQSVEIQGNEQTNFNFGESAQSFGMGMLFGGALAKGANYLADVISPTENFLKKVYENADEAQTNIVNFLKETTETTLNVGDKKVASSAEVVDPGIKTKESLRRKVDRKSYQDPSQVTDVVRAGIKTDRPDEADAIVKTLSENFKIVDEGWRAYPGGYFDRKVLVTTPEGKTAEVQIFSREIGDAKNNLWNIYDKARLIENDESKKSDYEKLMKESEQVAAAALVAGSDIWKPIYDQLNLTVPGL